MAKRRRRSLTKAAQPPVRPAATFSAEQVAGLLATATGQLATPLPRTDPQVPFGPGLALQPSLINPPREDGSGRSEPRIYEYPVSINLPGMTDRLVPWKVLRDAAEIPVVRDCIRIRKNKLAAREWDIVVTKRALQQYRSEDPDTSSVAIKRELRRKLNPEIARLVEFWQRPDFQQGESFVEWAGKVLEEHLVLDAVALYPFHSRGGDQLGFRALDGSTVKPLLDQLGGRPMPPQPAFQQILWGFPRGEFIADVDDEGQVIGGYDADRLIYRRREVRTFTPYGFSSVEQALQDVDLYLRRLEWMKAQYTDAVVPAGWLLNEGQEHWTPQQLADYSRAINDLYSGQTLERMRLHLLPPGIKPVETSEIGEKYKPEYDLHLIKLVAMHFDTTVAELGFTEAKGLGSSGYHEGQENVQERKADNPDQRWLQAVLTEISRTHLGMPPELEFRFLGLDAEEEAAADEVLDQRLRTARLTLNEAREEQGQAPYSFPEADMPMVMDQRGIVFLEGASAKAPPGVEITPAQAPQNPGAADPAQAGQNTPPAGQQQVPPKPAGGKPAAGKPGEGDDAGKAEIAAYWKWARNGHSTSRRPFVFKHATPGQVMLHEIPLDTVKFEAGDADPKGPEQDAWPTHRENARVARFWAARLREAFSGAPTRVIATRWLALRKAADPQTESRRRDALAWLVAVGFTLAPQTRKILTGLYADAYMLGDHSAQVLLRQAEHTLTPGWEPGDTAVAEETVARAGMAPQMRTLLGQAQRVADGINHTRLTSVAEVLGDAVDTQPTVDDLDAELQALLGDETDAEMVAVTEVSRGAATAAVDRYTLTPGINNYEWLAAAGACPICLANAAVGPIPIGQSFPSGDIPPAHPWCRCSVVGSP